MADERRWYLCHSTDGYVALEKAYSETDAATQAAKSRPGYENCWAEPYSLIAEEEEKAKKYDAAIKNIERIMESLAV